MYRALWQQAWHQEQLGEHIPLLSQGVRWQPGPVMRGKRCSATSHLMNAMLFTCCQAHAPKDLTVHSAVTLMNKLAKPSPKSEQAKQAQRLSQSELQ